MYTKICPRCHKTFTTWTDRAKYCSAACREASFKEKTRTEARAEKEEAEEAEAKAWKAKADARAKRRWREIEKSASNGDPLSRMQVEKKFTPEYFSALKDYEEQFAKESGKASTLSINGISIEDPDFPQAASYAVWSDGVCALSR